MLKDLIIEPLGAIHARKQLLLLLAQKDTNKNKVLFLNQASYQATRSMYKGQATWIDQPMGEQLLNSSILTNDHLMDSLIKAYLVAVTDRQPGINRNSLRAALPLLYLGANHEDPLGVVKEIGQLLSASDKQLIQLFTNTPLITVKDDQQHEYYQRYLETVKEHPQLLRNLLSFLWQIHRKNGLVKQHSKTDLQQGSFIFALGQLESDRYGQLMARYLLYSGFNGYLDFPMGKWALKGTLSDPNTLLSISSSPGVDHLWMDEAASQAQFCYSSLENNQQEFFLAWLVSHAPDQLVKFSTGDLRALLSHLDYGSRINGYLTINSKSQLQMARVGSNIKYLPFNIRQVAQKLTNPDQQSSNTDLIIKSVESLQSLAEHQNQQIGQLSKQINQLSQRIKTLSTGQATVKNNQQITRQNETESGHSNELTPFSSPDEQLFGDTIDEDEQGWLPD